MITIDRDREADGYVVIRAADGCKLTDVDWETAEHAAIWERTPRPPRVNWVCFGGVSVEDAKLMVEAMTAAIEFAEGLPQGGEKT